MKMVIAYTNNNILHESTYQDFYIDISTMSVYEKTYPECKWEEGQPSSRDDLKVLLIQEFNND